MSFSLITNPLSARVPRGLIISLVMVALTLFALVASLIVPGLFKDLLMSVALAIGAAMFALASLICLLTVTAAMRKKRWVGYDTIATLNCVAMSSGVFDWAATPIDRMETGVSILMFTAVVLANITILRVASTSQPPSERSVLS